MNLDQFNRLVADIESTMKYWQDLRDAPQTTPKLQEFADQRQAAYGSVLLVLYNYRYDCFIEPVEILKGEC